MDYSAGHNSSALDIILQSSAASTYGMLNFMNVTSVPPELEVDEELLHLQDTLATTRLVVQKVLIPTIVLFGVVGNMMTIAVLTRRCMRSSTNFYLTALAIYDILYLVFALTMSLNHYTTIKSTEWYIRYRKPIGKPFVDTASNTGVWLTLTFTIERYIGVCHPMKGKRWCTPERARIVIFIVCFITAIITFPEFFEYIIVELHNADNSTVLKTVATSFASTSTYQWGYVYTNQTLFTFLPLLLLLIFNSLLIRAVTAASKSRKAMVNQVSNERQQRQQAEQHKKTVMLISVVIVFLICQLPQAILNLYSTYLEVTKSVTSKRIHILLIINNVCNFLVMINSSINFVLYSSFSTKFRRTFKRLFCKCLFKKSAELNVFTEYSNASALNGKAGRKDCGGRAGSHNPPVGAMHNTPRMKNGYVEVKQDMDVGRERVSSL